MKTCKTCNSWTEVHQRNGWGTCQSFKLACKIVIDGGVFETTSDFGCTEHEPGDDE